MFESDKIGHRRKKTEFGREQPELRCALRAALPVTVLAGHRATRPRRDFRERRKTLRNRFETETTRQHWRGLQATITRNASPNGDLRVVMLVRFGPIADQASCAEKFNSTPLPAGSFRKNCIWPAPGTSAMRNAIPRAASCASISRLPLQVNAM